MHWLDAAQQAGYAHTPDFNGEKPEGVGPYQLTIRGHWRCSAADAFLTRAVRARPNLTIRTDAHVARVTLDANSATGIE